MQDNLQISDFFATHHRAEAVGQLTKQRPKKVSEHLLNYVRLHWTRIKRI